MLPSIVCISCNVVLYTTYMSPVEMIVILHNKILLHGLKVLGYIAT